MSSKEVTSSLFAEPVRAEPVSKHVIRMALTSAADAAFDYAVPEGIWPIEVGRRVLVPFGKGDKHETAFVVAADVPAAEVYGAKNRAIKLKSVLKVVDEQPLLGGGVAGAGAETRVTRGAWS